MTFLPDNKLALIFENADTPGFIRTQTRGSEWMNIDIFIFPDKIIKKEYWLE